jgi:hypothetical protein
MGKVKPSVEKKNQVLYLNTVPNEILPGFRGRESAPDSPIMMSMINAGKAATRAARADIVPTLINLIKPNFKSGRQYVKGEMVGVIKFNDRYKGEINFEETDSKGGKKWVGKDKFYNYLPNGDIEVWQVNDPKIIEALRPEWEPEKTTEGRVMSAIRTFTSLVGQGHTRYQPKFAPYDFIRNTVFNSTAIANELGPANGAKYFAIVGKEVFGKLRIPQMLRVAGAYNSGNMEKIKKIGGYNPSTNTWRDPFVRDAYRYLERGGRVSIVRSWQTRGKFEQLLNESNKGIARKQFDKTKEAVDWVFDSWMDGFDFVARVQAYRSAMSVAETDKGLKGEDAERFALSFAKNTANFEKKGIEKWPTALFAFWGPSATGAVRAFESIAPAFRNARDVLEELPEEIKNDPAARENYFNNYVQQKRNAQMTLGFLLGMGFVLYEMARSLGGMGGDDDEQKNSVASDSKELWTRNVRIPLDWLDLPSLKDKYFQFPWGFGMGAFGAAGAQFAAFRNSDQSFSETVGNLAAIASDSFLPLPIARYNPTDAPLVWLFDSSLPTVVRPIFESIANMSGTGQTIYRDYYNKYGPAYGGSENVEEMYRYITDTINKATLGRYQFDPAQVRFFLTAYADGFAGIGADMTNIVLAAKGVKDFDIKTDTVFLDSFIGNKISPSLIKYGDARKKLEILKRGYDTAINNPDEEFQRRFLEKYPEAPAIVQIYNMQTAQLNKVSQATNAYAMYAETPADRKAFKKEMNGVRDMYMDQVSSLYEAYKDDIDTYYDPLFRYVTSK